ncbi:MAG: replicative DNA helicase [Ignavibacteria bacterium]|nr:replicative DNA helicase [Ignavibacteria bacterium]
MAKTKKKRISKQDILDENFEFEAGRVPPNAIDLESKILGAILIDNEIVNEILQFLDYTHFYRPAHGTIFQAITNLDVKREPIDPHTLKEELKRLDKLTEVGGIEYIIDLTTSVSTSANAVHYSRIIYEKYILRNLISISSKIVNNCFDPTANTYNMLDNAEQKILEISESLSKKKVISVKDEIEHVIEELGERRHSDTRGIIGIPTGFDILDDKTAGFQNSELIIIAGRPSHGKTALATNIARYAVVEKNKSVVFFSLEMSFRELILRLLASEASVDGKLLKSGKSPSQEWERVQATYHKLKGNFFIDDSSELSVLELRAKARRLKREHGIDMVIVDYLQLVKGQDNAERRDLEVAYVSRSLKALAKELEIPVVACSQLNRSIEQRGKEKRPQLADLRESGAIEQDADVVLFVHRPVIGMSKEEQKNNPDKVNIADIVIGKQRNGPTDEFQLVFVDKYAKFNNIRKSPDTSFSKEGEEDETPF